MKRSTNLANAYKGTISRWHFLALITALGVGALIDYRTQPLTAGDIRLSLAVLTFIVIGGFGLYLAVFHLLRAAYERLEMHPPAIVPDPPTKQAGDPDVYSKGDYQGKLSGLSARVGGSNANTRTD